MILKTVYCLKYLNGKGYVRMVKPSNLAWPTVDPELVTLWVDELECHAYRLSLPNDFLEIKKVHIRVED